VELNATFRRMPTASAIAGWVGATPPDFRFAAKVHQSITHFKRLKDADESMRFFLQSLEPMRQSGKLGPILVQTPPNLKADLELLRAFSHLLAQAYRFAFEFRHESWFNDGVYEILKSRNAALCWAESEKIVVPKVATADFLYYRFREPEYSTPDLEKVAAELKDQAGRREVYAFFKHEEQPESALNAQKVARACGIEERPFALPEKKGRKTASP
jgi:uncharacterized protein YecE (DUF72 family)